MPYYPPVSPYSAGLACKCPRCGRGALFDGFLTLRSTCKSCQLDFSTTDSGDGPAVFAIFITGFLSVAIAFVTRFTFGASILGAFIVSAVFASVLTACILRPLKATLIALQYVHKAKEGVVTSNSPDMQAKEPLDSPPLDSEHKP